MDKLNINDFSLTKVLSLKKRKENKDSQFIEKITDSILIKIKNKKQNGQWFFFYEIPNFIAGLPLYDSIKISKIVQKKLNDPGTLEVIYMYENKIFISWKKKEKEFLHIPILLERIKRKIQITADKEKDNCIYEIPAIVTGTPIFDCEEAAKMVKKEIKKEGFLCKIIYTNQLFISWNVKDIEKMNDYKIKFRTNEEKMKQEQKEYNLTQKEKYVKFKNPEYQTSNVEEENLKENLKENLEENDSNYYFNLDIKSNPSRIDDYYPEAASFYKYYEKLPPSKLPNDTRRKHSKEYTSNTKTFFPVEYTDPPIMSKIKFGEEKRIKKINRFNNLSNPEKKKSNKTVNFTQNYTSNSSSLSQDSSILTNLESLKKHVNKFKIKR
jgi:hypothetical protein